MVEKPIGHDLASARALDRIVREVFDEPQVFRIDHYVGKEAVQNILVFRFANSMVDRAWSRDVVDHVQITVAESDGIEQRGRYYEEAGALRDMVQNHLLQVLSFVAMEPPDSLAPEDVRDRKAELLDAMRPLSAAELVRGQYTAGVVEGREVPGYRDEERVAPESSVETFVALRAWIDNARWKDVPFFLRTGKRLPHRATEVAMVLRESDHRLFEGAGIARLPAHHLALRIQPEEGISLVFRAKEPGPGMALDAVPMDFAYGGLVQDPVGGGLRAPPARRDGGRSDALPARGRGRAVMGDRGSRPRRFRDRASLRRGDLGPKRRRRADRPACVAPELSPSGVDPVSRASEACAVRPRKDGVCRAENTCRLCAGVPS